MKKKNPHQGSSLDDFLEEEGIYEEVNPKDGNVTIKTLHKAAAVVGKRFEYKLV